MINIKDFETSLLRAENKLLFLKEQKATVEEQFEETQNQIKQLEDNESLFLKASSLLQFVSEKTREQSITRIEFIVSQALQEVLDNKNLKFKIVFENKRNIVTAEFKIWDDELQKELNINKSEAGGIKNIVGAILRLLVLDLYHPKISGPIVMDEIGANISKEYQARFGKFLQQYSQLTGRQIILVSHHDLVKEHADRTIRIQRVGTESKVVAEVM